MPGWRGATTQHNGQSRRKNETGSKITPQAQYGLIILISGMVPLRAGITSSWCGPSACLLWRAACKPCPHSLGMQWEPRFIVCIVLIIRQTYNMNIKLRGYCTPLALSSSLEGSQAIVKCVLNWWTRNVWTTALHMQIVTGSAKALMWAKGAWTASKTYIRTSRLSNACESNLNMFL